MKEYGKIIVSFIYKLLIPFSFFIGNSLLHWIASQLYTEVCAPSGLIGYISSIIYTTSSYCIFMNNIMYYTNIIHNNTLLIFFSSMITSLPRVDRPSNQTT